MLGFLLALVLIAVLALTSIYRASCGDPSTARPQYFVVLPTTEVPEDCRGARNGLSLLRRGVRTESGS